MRIGTMSTRLYIFITVIALMLPGLCGLTGRTPLAYAQPPFPGGTPGNEQTKYNDLQKTIEASIQVEKENIDRLKKRFEAAKAYEKELDSKINTYKILLSSHGSLLISSDVNLKAIENARGAHMAVMEEIQNHVQKVREELDSNTRLLQQAEEQYNLNTNQLSQINTEGQNVVEAQRLIETLQPLIRLLAQKVQLLEILDAVYGELLEKLNGLSRSFVELKEKFDKTITEMEKKALFKRKFDPLFLLNTDELKKDLSGFAEQAQALTEKQFWSNQFQAVRSSGIFLLISCIILFGLFQFIVFRGLRHLESIAEKTRAEKPDSWFYIVLRILCKSMLLLGVVLFIYVYAKVRLFWDAVSIVQALVYLLMSILFTRWGLDCLSLISECGKLKFREGQFSKIRSLIRLIRYFALFHIIMKWLLGVDNMIVFLGRGVFEFLLLIWCVTFWKEYRNIIETDSDADVLKRKKVLWIMVFSYGIILGGILIDIAGYGSFALYWYKSWGLSAVAIMWFVLFFLLIYEWNQWFKEAKAEVPQGSVKVSNTIRWFFVQVAWMALFIGAIVALLFAWGAKQTIIVGFFKVLNKSISFGNIDVSILGFVYAVLALVFTHALVGIWKHRILEGILAGSGFEIGIKNSIQSISTYLLWALGVLIALNFAGVSGTSLAVIFGAISIGLGFGLQNIFNNFVSGIILLFERPIQVGDAVEVNGVWGEVRKINVRSTLVQTYNNSTLIIPNSDFISSLVTNWSFKDKRVRRLITVGVAYGSDVQLVRKTLLEAAWNVPDVNRYPEPSVIFSDFGDSALVFVLRIWAHVDLCLTAESDVRFEIDRLFAHRNITIPFPQRDVHLFTKDSVAVGESPEAETETDTETESESGKGGQV